MKPVETRPSQVPEEGAGPLPSVLFLPQLRGFGERLREGRKLVPSLWSGVWGKGPWGAKGSHLFLFFLPTAPRAEDHIWVLCRLSNSMSGIWGTYRRLETQAETFAQINFPILLGHP